MGKGAHHDKVPRAPKRHSAALSPCQLCSPTSLEPCKVEEEVCVWCGVGGHQRQRLERYEIYWDTLMKNKRVLCQAGGVAGANSYCVFTLLKCLMSLCPDECNGGTSIFPYSHIGTCGAFTNLLLKWSEMSQVSGATVDELFSFKYPGCLNISPIATTTDICVILCSQNYRLWIPINLCPNPSPTLSQLIHKLIISVFMPMHS